MQYLCNLLFYTHMSLMFAVFFFFHFRQLGSTITRNLSLASDAKIMGQFFGQAGVSLVQYFSSHHIYISNFSTTYIKIYIMYIFQTKIFYSFKSTNFSTQWNKKDEIIRPREKERDTERNSAEKPLYISWSYICFIGWVTFRFFH